MKIDVFINNSHEFEYEKIEEDKYWIHILRHSENGVWQDDVKGTVAFKIKERIEDSQLEFPSVSSFSIAEAEYFDILLRLVLREENMPRIIEVCSREAL